MSHNSAHRLAHGVPASSYDSTERKLPSAALCATPEVALEQVQLHFDLRDRLQQLLVENNKMFLLTLDLVYIIDLSDPLSVSRVSLPRDSQTPTTLSNAWLHPSGDFLVVQMDSSSHYILHSSYVNFKPLSRLRGLPIKFMAFSSSQNANSAEDLVAVTRGGVIYVVTIKCHDPHKQGNKRDDKSVKQVFDMKNDVLGILLLDKDAKFQLISADGTSLIWTNGELPNLDLANLFRQKPTEQKLFDQRSRYQFHGFGAYYYCIEDDSGAIFSNDQGLAMETLKDAGWKTFKPRTGEHSLITTDHFFLYLLADCKFLVVMSKLIHSEPLIISLAPLIGDEQVLGITSERDGNTRWIFTQSNVYEIVMTSESTSLWYAYYKGGNYDAALKLLEAVIDLDEARSIRNTIYSKQAYELLQKGGFGLKFSDESPLDKEQRLVYLKRGVELLAKLHEPLEKVALMFLSISEDKSWLVSSSRESLEEYLQLKLKQEEPTKNSMSKIIFSTWIAKMMLEYLREIDSIQDNQDYRRLSIEEFEHAKMDVANGCDTLLIPFLEFNITLLDSKTIHELMISMGFESRLIELAIMLEDYEFVVKRSLENEAWSMAIQAMKRLHSMKDKNASQITADASFLLLLNAPQITIGFWLTLDDLDLESLLPAIIQYNRFHQDTPYAQNLTFYFFLKVIHERKILQNPSNNQYLSLLMAHKVSGEDKLINKEIMRTLEFLRECTDGLTQNPPYDANLLLRSSLRFHRVRPAISILINDFGYYEAALTLAMEQNSRLLCEFVLKSYDESIGGNQNCDAQEHSFSRNSEPRDEHGSTRLENEYLKSRKNIWFKYAKLLIGEVCDDIRLNDVRNSKEKITPSKISTGSSSNDAAKHDTEHKAFGDQSSALSGTLRYLFGLPKLFGSLSDPLTFKDILPLLPESVLINDLRDDIVYSLQHYNNQINHLGLEMRESSHTAAKLKKKVKESRSNANAGRLFTVIEPGESCCLCGKLLVEKNILLFQNCHHGYHKECAARFSVQLKGDYRFKKLFQEFKNSSDTILKNSLESLLSNACPFCNDSNLNTLGEELIASYKAKSESDVWSMGT